MGAGAGKGCVWRVGGLGYEGVIVTVADKRLCSCPLDLNPIVFSSPIWPREAGGCVCCGVSKSVEPERNMLCRPVAPLQVVDLSQTGLPLRIYDREQVLGYTIPSNPLLTSVPPPHAA
jgi:hypothetical protein